MSTQKSPSVETLTLVGGIVIITALAWLFSERFVEVEQLVAHNLFDTFASSNAKLSADHSIAGMLIRMGITAGFATCGTIAACQLSKTLRWVVLVQLIALNLVLHVILAMSGELLAMPLSLSIASVLGIGFGYTLKRMNDTTRQLLAKDAAIEIFKTELLNSRLQLIKDDEVERRALAGDLHDQVLNDLKVLREKVKSLSNGDGGDTKVVEELDALIVRSAQQVREVMDSLSPAVLQHLGFTDAIEDCIRLGAERAPYKVRFRCSIEPSEFEKFSQTELTLLYRLVQESINNICKHAGASVVKCTITADGDTIKLAIIDDGKGMDQTASQQSQSRGLKYMQQRASIVGAKVQWLPGDDGKGTKVDITIRKPG